MTLEIRPLEHFLAVAEDRGFAKAARRLGMSQPSLTRSIAQLEGLVGTRLFTRSTSGTTITLDGRRLLSHAQMIVNEAKRAETLFNSGEEAVDQIAIGTSPSLLHTGLPDAIKAVATGARTAAVVVVTGTLEHLQASVRAREIDIALCLVPTYLAMSQGDGVELFFEEIGRETLVAVAAPDHPIFDEPPSLERATAYGWAVPHQMSVSYRFETVFYRRNLPIPPQRLNCASMALLRIAVTDWSLIGVLPARLAAEQLASGTLRRIELDDLSFDFAITLITAKSAPLSQTALLLIAELRTCFKDGKKG